MKRIRFLLVGPGKVGISLGAAWVRAGHLCAGVEGGSPEARRRARDFLGTEKSTARSRLALPDFDLLLIAVPDREVAAVARSWRERCAWKGRVALHTSGVLGASALAPLRRRGASVAALHPLLSLARPDPGRTAFRGVCFGIEGDPGAARMARRLARQAGGRTLEIPARGKALYHLSACLSSGDLLGLIDAAASRVPVRPADRVTLRNALLKLSESTLRNARERGLERALTGPIPRGDATTIRTHLRALRGSPAGWRSLHRILARNVLGLTLRSGRIKPDVARRIRALLRGPR
mgnify:CR=1 FL=1